MWKMCTYEQLHWHLSYVTIFHIAMSLGMWKMGNYEELHWQLSYVTIFHISIDRRVIRDVENEHL